MSTQLCAKNIAEYLPLRAQENPELLAIAQPISTNKNGHSAYKTLTYQELNDLCVEYIKGLTAFGLRKGMRCALMVKPSIEFFAFTFALLRMGVVLVAIDPGMGIKNIKTCLTEAEIDAFIGIGQAHLAQSICRWPKAPLQIWCTRGKKCKRFGVATQHHLLQLGQSQSLPVFEQQETDMAAILFTSGSTGVPKGVVYTHSQFIAQVNELQHIFGIEVGERDLCTFPLFALFAPALGMSSYIPDMDFTKPGSVNPLHILTPVNELQITNMFGSPALLKQVAQSHHATSTTIPSLKRVISAGAPARPDVLASFSQMLAENTQIYTPYGATESLPVSNIGSHAIIKEHKKRTDLGHGVCVGHLAPSINVSIIGITDEPIAGWSDTLALPPTRIGEICVSGPVVSKRYFNRPQSSALAKIKHHHHIIHRMGDIGYIDEQGLLWFLGRKAHRVESQGKRFFSIACEAIYNQHPAVERSALIPLFKNGQTVPAICIELVKGSAIEHSHLAQELIALSREHKHCNDISDFFIHPSFPVDIRHNAKINRELLAQWARKRKALTV